MSKSGKISKMFTALLCLTTIAVLQAQDPGDDCTNIIVTRGATTSGSVHICYTCDAPFASHLQRIPAGDHKRSDFVDPELIRGNVEVQQIPHTYAVIASNGIGHINEHQLAIGETTFDGRRGLGNKKGLHYADLMTLALQRCTTARQAIRTIARIANCYGYRASGESISIGDTKEAWLMEIIGKGEEKGIVWVAVKIPDGEVCAHANQSKITRFPQNDPENCLFADDVISFAKKMGYYEGKDEDFNFSDAYDPASERKKKVCAMRVWSILRRTAPSLNLSADYARNVKKADRYPLHVKPDFPLDTKDVFALLRDHYEGTKYDMTKGEIAGAFGSPNQKRAERSVSTTITAFSIVTESRANLPDPVGGLVWYSPDDTYFSCYTPLYCGITTVPGKYTRGERNNFSWDSAWWTINFVSNYSNLRYNKMKKDIQAEQSLIENGFMQVQSGVERAAASLWKKNPEAALRYLTDYSVSCGDQVMKKWKALAMRLISKYTR